MTTEKKQDSRIRMVVCPECGGRYWPIGGQKTVCRRCSLILIIKGA